MRPPCAEQGTLRPRYTARMKDCTQCGKCCINYSDGGLSATADEIARWEDERPDIARFVHNGRIWMDPETGAQLTRCPWLQCAPDGVTYSCAIYLVRPEDCRVYPVAVEDMIKDGCEMLEPSDMTDPERAQRTLDRLMSDSRPPLNRRT